MSNNLHMEYRSSMTYSGSGLLTEASKLLFENKNILGCEKMVWKIKMINGKRTVERATDNVDPETQIKIDKMRKEEKKKKSEYHRKWKEQRSYMYTLSGEEKIKYEEELNNQRTIKRFESKYKKNEFTNCYEWTGAILESGYGEFYYDGMMRYAHRVAWLLKYGEIPEGKEIGHTCNNKHCVNTDHLILTTPTERMGVDHSNTTCYLCGSKETRTVRGSPEWMAYRTDEKGNFKISGENWDEKTYICFPCYHYEYKKLSHSWHSKRKAEAKWRNKELSKDSNCGKGFIGEQIWCKVRGVKNCNIELNDFQSKYDHSPDPEYGITNTKIATFNEKGNYWSCGTGGEYDHLVLICMDSKWDNIEQVFIIPKQVTIKKNGIKIKKDSNSKYNKYKVNEKPYNEAYQTMSLENCPVLK